MKKKKLDKNLAEISHAVSKKLNPHVDTQVIMMAASLQLDLLRNILTSTVSLMWCYV